MVASKLSMSRALLVGATGGLLWGLAMRAWMRLVSTDPEFTWTGTLFIIGFTTLGGAALGTIEAARRRGRSRWFRVLAISLLPLGLAAGATIFPTAWFGGYALSGRGPVALRGIAAVIAAVPIAAIATGDDLASFGSVRSVTIVITLSLLCLVYAAAVSVVFRRWGPFSTSGVADGVRVAGAAHIGDTAAAASVPADT